MVDVGIRCSQHRLLACLMVCVLILLTLLYLMYESIHGTPDYEIYRSWKEDHFGPDTYHPEEYNDEYDLDFKDIDFAANVKGFTDAQMKVWKSLNEVHEADANRKHFLYVRRTHTRFANAIFQFVAGLAIGKSLNRSVKFSRGFPHLLEVFPRMKPYMELVPMAIDSGLRPLPAVVETGAAIFDKWIAKSIPENLDIQICCYFQSYKYFQGMEQEVRQMLQPRQEYVDKVSKYLQQISSMRGMPLTFIGIHVRRGDMTDRDAFNSGRLPAHPDYLHNAMKYFRGRFTNAHFVICSDGIEWCKKNIKPSPDITFATPESQTSSSEYFSQYFDFVLLSMCDHSIMTVGTYGWWTSWLANGTVVYYEYQNKPGSYYGRRLLNEDFFPPTWIPMGSKATQKHRIPVGSKATQGHRIPTENNATQRHKAVD